MPDNIAAPIGENSVSNLHIAFKAEFEVLKKKVTGIIEKDEKGINCLVMPEQLSEEASGPVSFQEMLLQFKSTFNMNDADTKSINDKVASLNKQGSSTLDKVNIDLQSLYLYRGPTSATNPENITEYAVSVAVDVSEAPFDIGFAKLNTISLQVWNIPESMTAKIMPGTTSIAKLHDELLNKK